MGNRIIAKFHPQEWRDDYAIPVEPLGPTSFDVTDVILELPLSELLKLRDDDYSTDWLARCKAAPEWIVDWNGPFWVEVAEAAYDYLYARGLANDKDD
jgi:hypothetical protein